MTTKKYLLKIVYKNGDIKNIIVIIIQEKMAY